MVTATSTFRGITGNTGEMPEMDAGNDAPVTLSRIGGRHDRSASIGEQ